MDAPIVRRAANGTLLPGSQLNVGGRPTGSISEFRARFAPVMPEVAETLLALMRSPNESTRLSACREILDRVLGRAAIAIDTTQTKVDIGAMYLAALKQVNERDTPQGPRRADLGRPSSLAPGGSADASEPF
jgi:hypothetical protein